MNAQQRKYALGRVETHFSMRKDKIRRKHTDPGIQLSQEQKIDALKKGRFEIQAHSSSRWPVLEDYLLFTEEVPPSKDVEKLEEEISELTAEYNRIRDEIMLGDEQTALSLIREFTSD